MLLASHGSSEMLLNILECAGQPHQSDPAPNVGSAKAESTARAPGSPVFTIESSLLGEMQEAFTSWPSLPAWHISPSSTLQPPRMPV